MVSMNRADIENIARAIAADYANRPDGLIEMLHRLQESVGYVPDEAVQVLADVLNPSRAEACQSMGADAWAPVSRRGGGPSRFVA